MRKFFRKCCPFIAAALLTSGCSGSAASMDDILIDEIEEEMISLIPESADRGTSLLILCRNDEFKQAFESLYGEKAVYEGEFESFHGDNADDVFNDCSEYIYSGECLPDGVEEIRIMVNMESYLNEDLDSYINSRVRAAEADPIDIFLTEPDYMYSHVNSDMTLPLSSTGFSEENTADMFPYTVALGTSENGELKAVSWQAEPGVFLYRRDIALSVFGDDSPEAVSRLISEDYENAAQMLKEAGYYMIASPEDAFITYSQNRTEKWVNGGEIIIGDTVRQWAEDMRSQTEKGFIAGYPQWSSEWMDGLCYENSGVFGYYLPIWGSEGVLSSMWWEDGSGCWGICMPPRPYFWGGAFLCVSSGTDNPKASGEFLRELCGSENMEKYAAENLNFANSIAAMEKAAYSEEFYSEFFGQNAYEIYFEAAKAVPPLQTEEYGELCGKYFSTDMEGYIKGYESYEDCEEKFISDMENVMKGAYE